MPRGNVLAADGGQHVRAVRARHSCAAQGSDGVQRMPRRALRRRGRPAVVQSVLLRLVVRPEGRNEQVRPPLLPVALRVQQGEGCVRGVVSQRRWIGGRAPREKLPPPPLPAHVDGRRRRTDDDHGRLLEAGRLRVRSRLHYVRGRSNERLLEPGWPREPALQFKCGQPVRRNSPRRVDLRWRWDRILHGASALPPRLPRVAAPAAVHAGPCPIDAHHIDERERGTRLESRPAAASQPPLHRRYARRWGQQH